MGRDPPEPTPKYVVQDQAFRVTCRGMRPSTKHTFLYEGVDLTSRCQQDGKALGAGLTTDASGTVVFTFHWTAGVEEYVDRSLGYLTTTLAGDKKFQLQTSDGLSRASRVVPFVSNKPGSAGIGSATSGGYGSSPSADRG
jgi:hypothetical protein